MVLSKNVFLFSVKVAPFRHFYRLNPFWEILESGRIQQIVRYSMLTDDNPSAARAAVDVRPAADLGNPEVSNGLDHINTHINCCFVDH